MRGKRVDAGKFSELTGLIPACAGKTINHLPADVPNGAHPRVCGENPPTFLNPNSAAGSSPRVRGKRRTNRHRAHSGGLIPACAGKTYTPVFLSGGGWAHPRVCGENGRGVEPRRRRAGSSPRVRGKPCRTGPVSMRSGLIPACAGKTLPRSKTRHASWAHPRVCGENLIGMHARIPCEGSSPRVRGKQP